MQFTLFSISFLFFFFFLSSLRNCSVTQSLIWCQQQNWRVKFSKLTTQLSHTAGRNVMVQALWKTAWQVLNKLNIELSYDVLAAQSYLTLGNPVDCSLSGSSIHGILQARILEWVTIPFSRDLPDPGIELRSPVLQADSLVSEPPGKSSVIMWPSNSTLRYMLKIDENIYSNKYLWQIFIATIFTITPKWKQPKCLPTAEWKHDEWWKLMHGN